MNQTHNGLLFVWFSFFHVMLNMSNRPEGVRPAQNLNFSTWLYVTQWKYSTSLLRLASSDVTSPCTPESRGWSHLMGVFRHERCGPVAAVSAWAGTYTWHGATVAASQQDIPPPLPRAWWLCFVSACVAARVCRKTECSSSRGCSTSTGACGDQSDFRCTTITKDSASNGTTRDNRVRPELIWTSYGHRPIGFFLCHLCIRSSSFLCSQWLVFGYCFAECFKLLSMSLTLSSVIFFSACGSLKLYWTKIIWRVWSENFASALIAAMGLMKNHKVSGWERKCVLFSDKSFQKYWFLIWCNLSQTSTNKTTNMWHWKLKKW